LKKPYGEGPSIGMEKPETPLEVARRHVAEQEARILQQQEIIRRLEAVDGSTLVAKQVLATMGRTLTIMRNDLARLSN
jgi:transcription elongation GreA/GreB family factor